MVLERWFGAEFVAQQRKRFGNLSPERRQLTYDIATEPEFAHWRHWYDEQLALLPQQEASRLAGRLWLDEFFWPVTIELAAGAALRDAGLTVAYEQAHDGLTPDWTVVNPDGSPAMFVEVHTDQPKADTFGRLRAWRGLELRIAKIPIAVVLVLESGHVPPKAPDGATAKKIAHEIRRRLLASPTTSRIDACGYTFMVLSDRYGPLRSPNGLCAQLLAPSGVAGLVDARRLSEAVNGKVRKYAELAAHRQVPLLVAAGAHRFTRVDLDDVDTLLAGKPTVSFQFNVGDTFIGSHTMNLAHPGRWVMPEALAGLLWIDNQPPFGATLRSNAGAIRPLPDLFTSALT